MTDEYPKPTPAISDRYLTQRTNRELQAGYINSWFGNTPISKGNSVSVMWRTSEVDTIFGFEKKADALSWIKNKSEG